MQLVSKGRQLDLTYPQIMGILNVTPDSFSDGGQYLQLDTALRQAEKMVAAGAMLIDVGGESTRPGAQEVSLSQQLKRVVPTIKAIADRFDVWISVDTAHAAVMRAAADAGAHLINDVYALRLPGSLQAAFETGLPVCLMHMQGRPWTMQREPKYQQIIQQISDFFSERIACCEAAGFARERLLLDPGFGFGKTVANNYQLLAQLAAFEAFNLPLLIGVSRKSMIGHVLDIAVPHDRVLGSVAAAVVAAMNGARIIRVHDVTETVQAMRIITATLAAAKTV